MTLQDKIKAKTITLDELLEDAETDMEFSEA